MRRIRILIADDHALMRIGLKSMLRLQPDMSVVGEAANGHKAIAETLRLRPDVVVMDLMMPGLDGATATKEILSKLPETKIIILSSFGTSSEMARALANGAAGAQMKESNTDEIISAIRTVATGQKAIAAEIRKHLACQSALPILTDKQIQVLDGVAQGLTDAAIADTYGITRRGVQKHLVAIFTKLGASNRAEAVAIALRKHLLKI